MLRKVDMDSYLDSEQLLQQAQELEAQLNKTAERASRMIYL